MNAPFQYLAFNLLFVVALGQGACTSPLDTYYCSTDNDCGSEKNGAGRCEPSSMCSYADSDCPDGQRYSESAGESSEQCVGTNPNDAPGAGGVGVGETQETCDDIFGHLAQYEFCSDTEDSCSFSVDLDFDSCADICQLAGTTCIGAQFNDLESGPVCTTIDEFESTDCDSISFSAVCECAI